MIRASLFIIYAASRIDVVSQGKALNIGHRRGNEQLAILAD